MKKLETAYVYNCYNKSQSTLLILRAASDHCCCRIMRPKRTCQSIYVIVLDMVLEFENASNGYICVVNSCTLSFDNRLHTLLSLRLLYDVIIKTLRLNVGRTMPLSDLHAYARRQQQHLTNGIYSVPPGSRTVRSPYPSPWTSNP